MGWKLITWKTGKSSSPSPSPLPCSLQTKAASPGTVRRASSCQGCPPRTLPSFAPGAEIMDHHPHIQIPALRGQTGQCCTKPSLARGEQPSSLRLCLGQCHGLHLTYHCLLDPHLAGDPICQKWWEITQEYNSVPDSVTIDA